MKHKNETTRRHHDCFSEQKGTTMLTAFCNIALLKSKAWHLGRFSLHQRALGVWSLGVWFVSALMLFSALGLSAPALAAIEVAPAPRVIPLSVLVNGTPNATFLQNISDNRGWEGPAGSIPIDATVTFELPQPLSRILFQWMNNNNNTYINNVGGGPVNYEIRVSSDSTNGINGAWPLASIGMDNPVRNNSWAARAHLITGNSIKYIRFVNQTNRVVNIAEIDIHDLSLCTPGVACDTWGFIGDSITEASFGRRSDTGPHFNEIVRNSPLNTSVPPRYPSMINFGVGGESSRVMYNRLDETIRINPGVHFWAIGIGTNNAVWETWTPAQTLAAQNTFRADLNAIVTTLQDAGKQPIIAHIPYTSRGTQYNNNVIALNTIVDEVTSLRGLPLGAGLYAYFAADSSVRLRDAVHPTWDVHGVGGMNNEWAKVALSLTPSGNGGVGSTVTITGGNVTATGGNDNGAGIGGDNVLIYGETTRVNATGSGTAQGIAADNMFVSLTPGNLTLSPTTQASNNVTFRATPTTGATGTVTATLPVFGSIDLLNGLTMTKNQSVITRFGATDNIAFALPGYIADPASPTTGAQLMATGATVSFIVPTFPTVTSVSPSGTGAALSGNIVITFSEAMNTTAGTVRLNNGAALTGGTWSSNTVFTIPYSGLSYSTLYTVNIVDFNSAAGTTMTPDNSNSFTTMQRPAYGISHSVTSGTHTFPQASPGYGAQTPLTVTVTVTNTGSLPTGALTVALSGANPTAFALSTATINSIASTGGTDTFTVRPNTGLGLGTYNATVTISNANVTPVSFTVSFTVRDITGPHVVSVSPSGTGVAVNGNIIVTFSEPIGTDGTVRLLGSDGSTYSHGGATLQWPWWNGNTELRIPYSGLTNGVTYTVEIVGFISAGGETMAPDNSHTFTVGTPSLTLVTAAPIMGVTSPVAMATPSTAINDGTGFTSALTSWTPADATFAYSTVYTARITLTAAAGYTFSGGFADTAAIAGFTVNNNAPTFVSNNGATLVFDVAFPMTGAAPSYTVSTSAGDGGSISPTSAQVNTGETHAFTVTPDAGYFIFSISGCGGTAVIGNNTFTTPLDYTTGAINAACTVSATFAEVTAAPMFQRAVSRKEHGSGAGPFVPFDLPISAADAITVEPRTGGASGAFTLVFQFTAPVSETGLNVALTGTGTVTETEVVGNEVIVKLTGVPDGTRLGITLEIGGVANAASANIGFLSGKVGDGYVVNQTDVTGVRTHVGAMLSEDNFIYDLDTDGTINQTDVTSVRTAVGNPLR